MSRMRLLSALVIACVTATSLVRAQAPRIDWKAIEAETLQHFQTLLRFDTSDPPGNEQAAAEYL